MAQDSRNPENQERGGNAANSLVIATSGLRIDDSRIARDRDRDRDRDDQQLPPPGNSGAAGGNSGATSGVSVAAGASNGDSGGAQPGPNGAGPANPIPGLAQDSLSLMQLKRLVGEGGRLVQPEYAFEYAPSDTLVAELSEWFSYSTSDLSLLIGGSKLSFEATYTKLSLPPHQPSPPPGKVSRWTTSKDVKRRRYISRCVDLLDQADQEERIKGLEGLSFIAQGVYGELHDQNEQVAWIKRNNKLLRKVGIADGVFGCLRKALNREWEFAGQAVAASNGVQNGVDPDTLLTQKVWNRRELKHAMTVLYFLIEVTRQVSEEETDPKDIGLDENLESFREDIGQLQGEGGLLGYLVKNIARVRWEDNADMPLTHLLLLAWKTTLLLFGSPDKHLAKVKQFARVAEGLTPQVDKNQITANPLDYFLFRQELIAKYPAYNPPKPLFAFETNSYLPSLTGHERSLRPGGNNDVLLGGKGGGENLASILDKAVHIATPMPSPPPSPVGVGKGQKKQNYQTNQSFPFMYPPADSGDPDDAGGIPRSIKEAGDIFFGRMRISLAMKQLWKEKEAFEKYGRGWQPEDEPMIPRQKWEVEGREPRWEEKRLAAVDEIYEAVLPQLPSLVIVLFKILLSNITAAPPAPPPAPPPPQNTFADEENKESGPRQVIVDPATGDVDFAPSMSLRTPWNLFGKRKNDANGSHALGTIGEDPVDPTEWERQRERERLEREAVEKKQWDDLDGVRMREITSKAVTALLLVLLKWFRVSHVLKFEYFTQLLWDANYIPLIMKLLSVQDVAASLTAKTDRPERDYFRICNLHSLSPRPLPSSSTESSSPDEACPPPIRFSRTDQLPPPPAPPPSEPAPMAPELITDLSWRNFFTSINIMRVLQKVVKNKSHRNLGLVQCRSSALLRKPLKCQQRDLRLYTLKVFKGQVPYCGRKWRQSNMRVITSIYLHCRPELRDDWLAGGDVDADVEEALPQEEALRALTLFYNVRRYPRSMGADQGMLEEERDFFRRELVRMQEGEEEEEEGEQGRAWEVQGGWS